MLPHSTENHLPRMRADFRAQALALSPLRLSNETHDFLMDAAGLLEVLNYEVDIPNDTAEEEEGDNDEKEYFREM